MKKLLLLSTFLVLLLTGCSDCNYMTDQKLRQEIFKDCLDRVPDGPEKTHYNDWSEVVRECGNQARYQAQTYICK